MFDPEALYERMAAQAWGDALDQVHGEPGRMPEDPVSRAALQTLCAEIGSRLRDESLEADDVERFVLLGRAGRLPVSRDLEARAIDALLYRLRDRPERAVSIARFRPDLPGAISVLSQFGPPTVSDHASGADGHRVSSAEPGPAEAGAGRSLFRSARERAFFDAARRVYAGRIVQANVALHAALDFDRVKGLLTATERHTFFRALVDCVVFDPDRGDRPIRFFELDSDLHDDALRGERDRVKDRIVTAAGHRLVRIRPPDGPVDDPAGAFERVLRHLESEKSIYSADTPSGTGA